MEVKGTGNSYEGIHTYQNDVNRTEHGCKGVHVYQNDVNSPPTKSSPVTKKAVDDDCYDYVTTEPSVM